MLPSFDSFQDELEKIAISLDLAERASASAWRKGLTGSRRPSAGFLRFDKPSSSTDHILRMADRKAERIHPLKHPIEKVKAHLALRRMKSNARYSEPAREWTRKNPGKNPSSNPHVVQPGKMYAGFEGGQHTYVVDTPGGSPRSISRRKQGLFEGHNQERHAADKAHEDKMFAAHKAELASRPPEKPFNPARAALLARRDQAAPTRATSAERQVAIQELSKIPGKLRPHMSAPSPAHAQPALAPHTTPRPYVGARSATA